VQQRHAENEGLLTLKSKMTIAVPYSGYYGANYLKVAYMKKFYTDDYPRANLGIMAVFLVIGVLVDAFTDPWFSNLTDNWVSKHGRRRPFIVMSAIYAPIVMLFAFLAPPIFSTSDDKYDKENVSGQWNAVYFGIFHIGWKLADTFSLISILGWAHELTPNLNERTSLWANIYALSTVFILVAIVAPALVTFGPDCYETPEDGCVAYPVLACGFVVLFQSIPSLYMVNTLKERDYRYFFSATKAIMCVYEQGFLQYVCDTKTRGEPGRES